MEHYLACLEHATRSFWDKSALNNYQGETFTYGQMATSIARFHLVFEAAGIRKGDKIAICARNSARWGIAFLAVNTYEAVVVPILADFTPDSVDYLVDHSESLVLFTNEDKWKSLDITRMPALRVAVDTETWRLLYCGDEKISQAYDDLDRLFTERYPDGYGPDDVHFPTDNFDDLAAINYTSGTSSAPKGVMLTYRNFSATIDFGQRFIPSSEEYTMLSMLPMAHMYGLVYEFLYPLVNGTAIYWLGKTPTPTMLLKAFSDVKPYLLITVPLVIEKIFKSKIKPALDKPAVKILSAIPGINCIIFKKIRTSLLNAFGGNIQQIIMGGAALNPEIERWLKRIGLPYTVGYGMTEAAPLLAYEHPWNFAPGSCGKPVDCADIRIDSEDPHHIAGEIQAKGENICLGYFKNPEASANAFTDDGYLRTGDLGIMGPHGDIFIRGRSKNMILSSSGQNIYPEEVEAVVNNQPYVVESVVVDRGGKLVALVYLDDNANLGPEDAADALEAIQNGANKALPSYEHITKVERMAEPFQKTPKMSIRRFLYK
ncbi:MAG: AMP-binding protein [Bacteroidales bacterium]|nr:AMP-binding protein [Bacteroidales bacterium]